MKSTTAIHIDESDIVAIMPFVPMYVDDLNGYGRTIIRIISEKRQRELIITIHGSKRGVSPVFLEDVADETIENHNKK